MTGAADGVGGFILSRATEKYGRPVSFVYAGNVDLVDGSEVFLNPARLRKSINYKLLQAGMAYPTYYEGLFADLREVMTRAVQEARSAGKGVWAADKSSGVVVGKLSAITDKHPVLPKLFRRLVAYLEDHSSVAGFVDHLAASPEGVLVLSKQNFTHFDDVIQQSGKRVGLTVPPEDLVFRP